MSTDPQSLRGQLDSWFAQLKTDRQEYEDFYNEVKTYLLPERGLYIKSTTESESKDGGRKDQKRINGEATKALRVGANGFQSGLTSKARPWLNIKSPIPAIDKLPQVRAWAEHVSETLTSVYASSNVYNSLIGVYTELFGFETGAQVHFATGDPNNPIFAKNYTCGQYWVSVDEKSQVDAFFVTDYFTVKQLIDWFGKKNVSNNTRRAFEEKRFEQKVQVIEAYIKDPSRLGLKVPNGMPIAVIRYEAKNTDKQDSVLEIKGFESWPVQVVRWDVIGNASYGVGVTRDTIGDIKALQRMEKDSLQGYSKTINPPLQGPPELQRRGINASPGGFTPVNNQNGTRPAISALYEVKPDNKGLEYKISVAIQRIQRNYFNDLFMAIQAQDVNRRTMTATEASLRNDEAFLILGPVLERIDVELLNPMIIRDIQILFNVGRINPPPEELIDSGLSVEYTSILSQRQKAVATARIDSYLGAVGRAASVWPQARNTVEIYEAMEETFRALGPPSSILATREVFDERNAAEAAAIEAREQAEVGEKIAKGGELLGKTDPQQLEQNLAAITGGIS